MRRSPILLMLIIMVCMDIIFTVMLGYTFFVTMEIEGDSVRTAVAVLAGMWVVKVIAWVLSSAPMATARSAW